MKKIFASILMASVFILAGCKKFLSIPPPVDKLANSSVYQNEATATAAVLGIYEQMMENAAYFANGGITLYAGLSGDELTAPANNSNENEFYHNQISISNASLKSAIWAKAYQLLYQANAVLEGLNGSPVGPAVKNQLTGEAKFVRAFCHFYLQNLFGDIPVITQTDYAVNARSTRVNSATVYEQIVKDLTEAVQLLPDVYVDHSNHETVSARLRPNRAVANALLARVYLYLRDWKNAEQTAGLLISHSDLYPLNPDPNQVFLSGSQEAIWQLMPVLTNQNTGEGGIFVQTSGNPLYGSLDSGLLASFEPGDLRFVDWIGSYSNAGKFFYYPAKYKVGFSAVLTEYYVVFRIAEQYLIRAEARNEQQNLEGAAEDLNIIRSRAGLAPTDAADYSSMQSAIEAERKHELFCEWGHRWLDLKRTGRIDAVLSLSKPSWELTDALYPIPLTEIQNDLNLTQNPGY